MSKTAVLLLNIGSPKSPNIFHVATYLSEFLGDKHVISLPWFIRKLLVYGVIVPFRSIKSSCRYKKLWQLYGDAFPLNIYGVSVAEKLQKAAGNNIAGSDMSVFIGMAYGQHTIKIAVKKIHKHNYTTIILFPLFPQYALSSTGVVLDEAFKQLQKEKITSGIVTVKPFYEHPMFISAWTGQIRKYDIDAYDLLLFSYHSLPAVQALAGIAGNTAYKDACSRTTQLICAKLGVNSGKTMQVYHSQLSSSWLNPFLNATLAQKAKEGFKRILLVMPGFVADCLETIVETEELKKQFLEEGGLQLDLVESLNDNDSWIQALQNIVTERSE